MSALTVSAIIFLSTLGGIFLPRRTLPKTPSERVRQRRGAAWGWPDCDNRRLGSWTAHSRRRELVRHPKHSPSIYCSTTFMARKLVRSVKKCEAPSVRLPTGSGAKRKQARAARLRTDRAVEWVDLKIKKLLHAGQRAVQARAVQISNDLAHVRFLLFAESENLIPSSFLAVLAFWLLIICASFSLFLPLNETVFTCLSLFALSSTGAIFLIGNEPAVHRTAAVIQRATTKRLGTI